MECAYLQQLKDLEKDEEEEGLSLRIDKKKLVIERNTVKTLNFLEHLKSSCPVAKESLGHTNNCVWEYLNSIYAFGGSQDEKGTNPLSICLNDASKFEPVNREALPDLAGALTLTVVDFFTHCCINCIHGIEDLRRIHDSLKKTEDEVQFVSVHSPKFTREKEAASVKAFVDQLDMDYSWVVSDPECVLWSELGISCWPTVLVLGPNPDPEEEGMNLLFTFVGEGHKEEMEFVLKSSLEYFKRYLKKRPVDAIDSSSVKKERTRMPEDNNGLGLKYPGKVAIHPLSKEVSLLAISDTGNHRLIVAEVSNQTTDNKRRKAVVKCVIGGGKLGPGYVDGDFQSCQFYFPQGLVFRGENCLLVADTGNHAIRQVDLLGQKVTTLVPSEAAFRACAGEPTHLRSPWDLTLYSQDILIIAAAGNHRILAYFFAQSRIFEAEYEKGDFVVLAGSGKEENRNNSYILKSSFAQPSGICVLERNLNGIKDVYIADSESSSIRSIVSEGKGKVVGIVGGTRNPTDLFSYGDVDGKGVDAKLQHPMGVCSNSSDGMVYFVDTFNNKVKVINTNEKLNQMSCSTLPSHGFNEPGGICIDCPKGELYIADTNNHSVKFISLETKELGEIDLKMPSSPGQDYNETFLISDVGQGLTLKLKNIPVNKLEGVKWKLVSSGGRVLSSGSIDAEEIIHIRLHDLPQDHQTFDLDLDLFLCGDSACFKRSLRFLIKRVKGEQVPSSEFVYETNLDLFLQ